MDSITVPSPAKVNLILKILTRRQDGCHDLFTVFHRISLADQLTLRKIPSGIKIKTNVPSLPADSRNLIWKAYELLCRKLNFKGGVHVTLKKHIPIGAGLGGGSSNAAAFLKGLVKLYKLRVSEKTFLALGAELGSDVNFFLLDVNQAVGFGRGERLLRHASPKKLWFVIVTFPVSLSTKKVYQAFARGRHASLTNKKRVVKLPPGFSAFHYESIAGSLANDLQPVSCRLYPPIQKVISLFEELSPRSCLMSGSGPTVFALSPTQSAARRLAKKMKAISRLHKNILIAHTF